MKKINIGLLGLGKHAKKIWLPTILQNKECNLFACSSNFIESHNDLPTDIKKYNSHEKLISDENIDAVLISTKNSMHSELVIKALDSNKHILCEKPLCFDSKSVDNIKQAQARSAKILCTGFMYRHHPQWLFVKGLFVKGLFVKGLFVKDALRKNSANLHISGTFQYNTNSKKNVRTESGEGGVVADTLCYFLDVFEYLSLGKPYIHSHLTKRNSDGTPISSIITYTLNDSDTATIYMSMEHSNFQRLQISNDHLVIDIESPFIMPKGKHTIVHTNNLSNQKQTKQFPAFNCYDSLLTEFSNSIKYGTLTEPLTSGLNNSEHLSEIFS